MAYVALYRKWRPDEFSEVKGQEHIVTTLKNQILNERIGHAYLFCGTRGTGKTSVAKLFAKAVNCEHPVDGSPCGQCQSCKSISEGKSMNVIEIDAASNNGVDNIRVIRDEVSYSPTEGKYKVYIIDEVHMLSAGAFNALLKTLEEPPSYVIFILATTESHKIPVTILSRCQRYDFRRISVETISERLTELMKRENIQVEEKAINYIAKTADGGMRDALSLLDQCISFYIGKELTYEKVLEVLGAVDVEVFGRLLDAIVLDDTIKAIDILDEIIWQGRELTQFTNDFIWYLRNILLIKSSENGADKVDMSIENIAILKEKAEKIDFERLMRYIRVLSELVPTIKYSTQKRVALEVTIIKLCKPQMETNYDSLLERLRTLEEKLEKGIVINQSADTETLKEPDDLQGEQKPFDFEEEVKKKLPPAEIEQLKEIIEKWPKIKGKLDALMSRQLDKLSVNIGENGHTLLLAAENNEHDNMAKAYFDKVENLNNLKDILSEIVGYKVDVQCVTKKREKVTTIDNYNINKINMKVEIRN